MNPKIPAFIAAALAFIAAPLAARGFDVLGVDIAPEKVRKLNAGEAPVDEPLLELLR